MAYGTYTFNKVQMGVESTPGTGVAASFIVEGAFASLTDTGTDKVFDLQTGNYVPLRQKIRTWKEGRLNLPAFPLTFAQFPHILEASILTATPGAGPNYLRTYAPALAAAPTIKTYTIEAYNTVITGDYREMPHAFVEEWTISGKYGEEWQCSANYIGRELATGSPTSLTTVVAPEIALFSKTKLYIDAAGGTVHTTQKTGTLMAAEIKYNSGIMYVPVGDGTLTYSALKYTTPTATYSVTVELEDGAGVVAAERTAFEAQGVRLMSLDCAGSAATKNMRIDWAGRHNALGDYSDDNGNTTVTITGDMEYNAAATLFISVQMINGAAAL